MPTRADIEIMMITVDSSHGGTGRSTTAELLAQSLVVDEGYNVILVGMDTDDPALSPLIGKTKPRR